MANPVWMWHEPEMLFYPLLDVQIRDWLGQRRCHIHIYRSVIQMLESDIRLFFYPD